MPGGAVVLDLCLPIPNLSGFLFFSDRNKQSAELHPSQGARL